MAKAGSVPSSSCQLITGESANQSTNLRAVNLPAVLAKPDLIRGSHDRAIVDRVEAPLLQFGRGKCDDEPEGLCNCRYWEPTPGQAPAGSNIGVLFYVKAAFFLGPLLKRIVLILFRFVSRNSRLPDKVSSNQLVPSAERERLQ